MKTKLITAIMATLFLASSVMALPTGSAHWSNKEFHEGEFSVQLTITDGASRIVAVVIPVDIALGDIIALSFWKKVTEFTTGWDPLIVLGIDLNGDGKYKAKDFAWEFSNAPELLFGDTFIQGENPTGPLSTPDTDFTSVNAFADFKWYVPRQDGTSWDWGYYGSLTGIPGYATWIPSDARVTMIKVLLGGSINMMDEVAFVDYLSLNADIILDEPNNSKARFEVVTKEG